MNPNQRSTRLLGSAAASDRVSPHNPFRALTTDSGRGSMGISERSSTNNSATYSGVSPSSTRPTPFDEGDDNVHEKDQVDKLVRIRPGGVFGFRHYGQAFVSHIDHPSAFFIQLSHSKDEHMKLEEEINEYYSTNTIITPSLSWERGQYCVAKFSDDRLYRARIIEVPEVTKTPNLYDVLFVDFGNWSKIAATDIYPILPRFATLSAQAIPCSLTKSLPPSGTWSNHPKAMKLFRDLVFEEYVDVSTYLKTARECWPFVFVDLKLSATKLDVRQEMKDRGQLREVNNEQIYLEFNHLLHPADYIIYSIPHEAEERDNDDDDD